MVTSHKRPSGLFGFLIVWVGQIISLLGTATSSFALTLWAYETTGKATPLAMVGFFFAIPYVALSPFVGVLIDRGNRKLMMMLSDLAAALATAVVLLLYVTGGLEIWHLYVTAAISGVFQGFQWPAYSAAITMMVPKQHYARANGMLGLAGDASRVFAPMLAGALIGSLGVAGLLTIDLVSAAIAIGTLLFIHIPQPEPAEEGGETREGFLGEMGFGIRYVLARPSLLGLQMVFLVGNFWFNLAYTVLAPMILGRTGNDEFLLGSVQSAGAIGGVVGGLLMGIWGGPRHRIQGVLLGWFSLGFLGLTVVGLGQSFAVWAGGLFLVAIFSTVIDGSNQAIWQAKVAPDVQGRVFSMRRFTALLIAPFSLVLAGQLVDKALEPAMVEGGALASAFGWLVGTDVGSGMALLFVGCGLLTSLTGLSGYLIQAVRDVEGIIPDHSATVA
jgi:MFS family permease